MLHTHILMLTFHCTCIDIISFVHTSSVFCIIICSAMQYNYDADHHVIPSVRLLELSLRLRNMQNAQAEDERIIWKHDSISLLSSVHLY